MYEEKKKIAKILTFMGFGQTKRTKQIIEVGARN